MKKTITNLSTTTSAVCDEVMAELWAIKDVLSQQSGGIDGLIDTIQTLKQQALFPFNTPPQSSVLPIAV
jgi:hypothetical protein